MLSSARLGQVHDSKCDESGPHDLNLRLDNSPTQLLPLAIRPACEGLVDVDPVLRQDVPEVRPWRRFEHNVSFTLLLYSNRNLLRKRVRPCPRAGQGDSRGSRGASQRMESLKTVPIPPLGKQHPAGSCRADGGLREPFV